MTMFLPLLILIFSAYMPYEYAVATALALCGLL
jgi:hypothetical protein